LRLWKFNPLSPFLMEKILLGKTGYHADASESDENTSLRLEEKGNGEIEAGSRPRRSRATRA
jgi:hypothetical protein